jgi:hypothetical protein
LTLTLTLILTLTLTLTLPPNLLQLEQGVHGLVLLVARVRDVEALARKGVLISGHIR